jgi:hypothetical protein
MPYNNDTTISPKNLEHAETLFVSSRANELSAYNLIAGPGLHHLQITDAASDGTCCFWGKGFITVTNVTDVLWGLTGSQFTNETNAYIWVNGDGSAERADYIRGLGYFLVKEDKKKEWENGVGHNSAPTKGTKGSRHPPLALEGALAQLYVPGLHPARIQFNWTESKLFEFSRKFPSAVQ